MTLGKGKVKRKFVMKKRKLGLAKTKLLGHVVRGTTVKALEKPKEKKIEQGQKKFGVGERGGFFCSEV